MRRYFIYLIIFSGFIYISFSQTRTPWIKLESPVDTFLRNLIFIDSLTGWAAGESGTIINTADGGINWTLQNSNVNTWITDIFFINENIGWALTVRDIFPFNTIILKTTTGGNEWITENFPDPAAFMTTILFLDSLNGFIGGSYIAKTIDGGISWTEADVESSMVSSWPVLKFKFFNKQFGYASGGFIDQAGVIWRTTNGGLYWTAIGVSPDEVFDLFIIDSLNAIALSGDPEGIFNIGVIRTTNAGEDWSPLISLPFFGLSFALDFQTPSEGWSASGYNFLVTTDTGETWRELETPGNSGIWDLQFTDAHTGYAVGEDGVILKFIPPPVNMEEEFEESFPAGYFLYQNYPNPFNPSTVIRYQLAFDSYVSLKVYNLLGQELADLINNKLSAGEYKIEYNASGLNSGIYFYTLKATGVNSENSKAGSSNFISTKKMMLLR